MEMKTWPNFVNPSSFLLCSFLPNFVTARIEEEKKKTLEGHIYSSPLLRRVAR